MVHKVILPDSCEPMDLDSFQAGQYPKLVFMVFGLFRYDAEGEKGVHSTRGEWLIVDEILERGDSVVAVQIAPRHNVRLVKDRKKSGIEGGIGRGGDDGNESRIELGFGNGNGDSIGPGYGIISENNLRDTDKRRSSSLERKGNGSKRSGTGIGGGTRDGANLIKNQVTGSAVDLDDDHELHKEPNPEPRSVKYPNQWTKIRCSFDSTLSISEAVQQCIDIYGKIDIVVNWLDLGFDYGTFSKRMVTGNIPPPPTEVQQQEEEMEIRKLMDQNAFSLFNIIKGTLPALRKNIDSMGGPSAITGKLGTSKGKRRTKSKSSTTTDANNSINVPKILSISSSLGFIGGPGINAYTTSRWACEGMMETLNYEVQDQGIRTTTIDLGLHPLQTAQMNSLGNLVWELAHCKNPPIRIALGRQATKTVKDKLRSIVEEVEDWKYLFEPSKAKPTKS